MSVRIFETYDSMDHLIKEVEIEELITLGIKALFFPKTTKIDSIRWLEECQTVGPSEYDVVLKGFPLEEETQHKSETKSPEQRILDFVNDNFLKWDYTLLSDGTFIHDFKDTWWTIEFKPSGELYLKNRDKQCYYLINNFCKNIYQRILCYFHKNKDPLFSFISSVVNE